MRRVTYSLGMSLDGYTTDTSGSLDWGAPDDEVFRFCIEEVRRADAHLMGRRLYETMLYWETAEDNPATTADELEWTHLWKALPKIVFSRSLTAVEGTTTRLSTVDLATEIAQLRAEPGDGTIAIGGPTLAREAAALDLIDDYLIRVHPVLLGGGTRFFAHDERQIPLELVDTRTFASGVVFLHHRVVR